MKKIALLGDMDKRIFAYGIMKVLCKLGTALWVTDNPLFLYASEDNEDRYTIGDSQFIVVQEIERLFDDSLWSSRDYDYVIYDCSRLVPLGTDVLFHIITPNKRRNDFQDEVSTLAPTKEKYRLYYCGKGVKSEYLAKGMVGCSPHASHITDVQKMENERILCPPTDPNVQKVIAYMLSKFLPDQSASNMLKRLQKKGW